MKGTGKCKVFFRHYAALMWKNFLIRRRRPWYLVAELLIPIMIPIVLVILRKQSADIPVPSCYSHPVTMPSLGLIKHLQSMLCNFQYACEPTEPTPFSFNFTTTTVQRILETLDTLTRDSQRDNSSLETRDIQSASLLLQLNTISQALTSLLGYPSATVQSTSYLESQNLTVPIDPNNLDKLMDFSTRLCGVPADKNDLGRFTILLKRLILERHPVLETKPVFGGDDPGGEPLEDQCAMIWKLLTLKPVIKYTERLRFFLSAMIYYYPSTAVTDEIMYRATYPQRMMRRLHELAQIYLNHTGPALHRILESSPLLRTLEAIAQTCKNSMLKGTEALSICQKFLNAYFSGPYRKSNLVNSLNVIDEVFHFVDHFLNCTMATMSLHPVGTEEAFKQWVNKSKHVDQPPMIGVHFLQLGSNGFYEVALRQIQSTHRFKVFDRYWTPSPRQNPPDLDVEYIVGGFMDLQEGISDAITSILTNRPDKESLDINISRLLTDMLPGQELKFFPTPCHRERHFVSALTRMLPQFMLFVWIFTVMTTTKYIVQEKEQRLKEFTKLMGVSNATHWFAWFTINVLIMFSCSIIITITLKFGDIINLSNYLLLLLLFLSYVVAVIAQTFLVSTFFTQANLGAVVNGMVFIVLYLPSPLIFANEDLFNEAGLFGLCLSCQVAFALGLFRFMRLELQGFGAQWSDFWTARYSNDVFSIGKCMLMLWVDAAIYFLLTWYFELVFPGKYGVRLPLYFPFTRSYWTGGTKKEKNRKKKKERVDQNLLTIMDSLPDDSSLDSSSIYFEAHSPGKAIGVEVIQLTKSYDKKLKPALDNLSVKFYANEITSLLGHNGAGKSTLMSILTGMQSPTSGTATINGFDVRQQLRKVRDRIGFCPQYNVLFSHMTVAEHIKFYTRLKGLTREEIESEIDNLVQVLGFPEKKHSLAKTLSGGQKRKLCVAIAFVGRASVVFLDEPTAGVDPYSRRSVWELINRLKVDRTVILTTHHMDEADILGDKIAIISQGKLKCHGSSLFLKTHHGQGYHLVFQRDPSNRNASLDGKLSSFDGERLLRFLQTYIPKTELVDTTLNEVIVRIPSEVVRSSAFPDFLRLIEDSQTPFVSSSLKELGFVTFGLCDTTLEEIFIDLAEDPSSIQEVEESPKNKPKVSDYFTRRASQLASLRRSSQMLNNTDGGQLPVPATRLSLIDRRHVYLNEKTNSNKEGESIVQPPLHPSLRQQFRAMFIKRFHYLKRSKRDWIIEYLLPVILILLALFFISIIPYEITNPPMTIHPWFMAPGGKQLNIFYENNMYAKIDPDISQNNLSTVRNVATVYEQALVKPYAFTGTRCMPHNVYQISQPGAFHCEPTDQPTHWTPSNELSTSEREQARLSTMNECPCQDGSMVCSSTIQPNPPPTTQLQTTDILYNLTAYNVGEYLIRTRDEFVLRRFGGLSFVQSVDLEQRLAWEILLDPKSHVYTLLGNLTSIGTEPDPFWKELANWIRLNLPPTHHFRVWFNNKGYVSAPGYLNLLQNMQLRLLMNNLTTTSLAPVQSLGIAIVNHPVNSESMITAKSADKLLILNITLVTFVILCLSFIHASYVTFLIREQHTGSKQLQFISGLNSYIYWITAFIWDFTSYLIPCVLLIIILVAFKKYAFVGLDTLGPFLLLLLFYGLAALPMLYTFSFYLHCPNTGLVVLVIFNVLIGSIPLMVTFFLELLSRSDENLKSATEALKLAFLVIPQYCFGRGMYELAFRDFILPYVHAGYIESGLYEDPLGWNLLGQKLCALGVEAVVFCLLVILLEHHFFKGPLKTFVYRKFPKVANKRLFKLKGRMAVHGAQQDVVAEDVRQEQNRVLKLQETGQLLTTSSACTVNLTKFFHRKRIPTVNRLSFAVVPGECFGLLGLNGAGKTTTFRMLTGSLTPSFGAAYVNSFHVIDQIRQAHQSLGFCPQFDATLDLLTGRETLMLYARIRGVPENQLKRLVTDLLTDMSLAPHADKCVGKYSGGNQRKLSTAIALLGDPRVIFLDEPTSGMDPVAKRFLWDQITEVVRKGKSVILTSHSMEECEALCHKLGIMVNGQFRCFGTVQQLKNRYGNGYNIEIRFGSTPESRNFVQNEIVQAFPGVLLKELQDGRCEFQLPQSVLVSSLFELLNKLLSQGQLEQYSVKQTSLDQVFVNFTRMQIEQEERSESATDENGTKTAPTYSTECQP